MIKTPRKKKKKPPGNFISLAIYSTLFSVKLAKCNLLNKLIFAKFSLLNITT